MPTSPEEFQPIYRDLAQAVQPIRALTPETFRVYWETLGDFEPDVLRHAAQDLRRIVKFFPSTAEWVQAARRVQGFTDPPRDRHGHRPLGADDGYEDAWARYRQTRWVNDDGSVSHR